MVAAEAMPDKAECPVLEITKQDFFQEAKTLIAQHYEKINEKKVQGTSINVFKNKHQKPKSGKFIPLEIKEKETLDVVQEFRTAHKCICFPKHLFKSEHFKEPSQRTSFKEPYIFSVKEKFKDSMDLIAKEQVKLGKIVTNIESVGKKMEKEKHQHHGKSRSLISPFATPIINLGLPLQPMTSSSMGLLKDYDKTFSDWRGIVPTKSSHLTPQPSWPSLFGSSSVLRDYCPKTLMKKEQQPIKPKPRPKPGLRLKSILSKSGKLDNKVKRIGPHIEIFQVFRERTKFVNTKKVVRMIIIIQAYVRGWLERKRLQRIMIKALSHGPNLRAVINMYCRQIHRVKYRLGLWRTRQIINFVELEEWMDRKKFYETMFAKREDWQGLERSELLKFFNDCGHFPTQQQIDEVWDLVHKEDHEKYSELIKKFNAIEMLFTLYPPQGAHVHNNIQLRSTWLRPIVDGEEGYRYIVNGHPILKRANIRIVGKLVSRSIRERKMRHLSPEAE
ncbi:IQ domain-containing protein M isoform X1 [Zalophus californianus]|uniref:IQ domain-containing protein M isoform X1 n=1 Tax=Zalophus californianus TaxID=9704 RepID=A0A6J2DGF6_ZALCA|nr:IQ domain-containing protein M isoform X1 [Zalophus californianus]XP_027455570.1 IQ domain-containing protein M isoform X1 [Zalophus californianus]